MTVTPPPERTDLTALFRAQASPHQIAAIEARVAQLARDFPGSYNGEWVIYAVYDTRLPSNQPFLLDEAPLFNRMWIGKAHSRDYPGGAHFVLDQSHYKSKGYISLFHQSAPSYDYGHELYPNRAPAGYRNRVDAEYRLMEQDEEEDEDDYDFDDDED